MIYCPFLHTPQAYITPAGDIMPKEYHPFRQERISLKKTPFVGRQKTLFSWQRVKDSKSGVLPIQLISLLQAELLFALIWLVCRIVIWVRQRRICQKITIFEKPLGANRIQ
jgi:hypothetical protein